eukprot:TRINITY_DN9362_c0_g1_i1.p1 TRINITY_DN9362_c0_g1~~TRINITY_DN9362_c0_g1_i1.p1  ORF type:complete len:538 (-),score=160.52 TRINITY_DN9362_c0_g1_i1:35-1648(-)
MLRNITRQLINKNNKMKEIFGGNGILNKNINKTLYMNNYKTTCQKDEYKEIIVRNWMCDLRTEFEGTPKINPIEIKEGLNVMNSTLENGLTVSSIENYSQTTAIALGVLGGSRLEMEHEKGATVFLEKLAYSNTEKYPEDVLFPKLETIGVTAGSSGLRESIVYAGEVIRGRVEEFADIIADTTFNSVITDNTIEEHKEILERYFYMDFQINPPELIGEMIHRIAYEPSSQLANTLVLDPEMIKSITPKTIQNYKDRLYVPKNMVLSAVGIEHERLVDIGNKYFSNIPIRGENKRYSFSPSKYTGGLHVNNDVSDKIREELRLPPNDDPRANAQVFLAFESDSIESEHFYNYAVLQCLLGGGASFTSGGPGSGYFSFLNMNVMGHVPFVHNISAIYSPYIDSGLFGIYVTIADPARLINTLELCYNIIGSLTSPFDEEILLRGKSQLKHQVYSVTDTRSGLLDDLTRQMLYSNKYISREEHIRKIDKVTIDDITNLCKNLFKIPPSIFVNAKEEHLKNFPSFDNIVNFQNNYKFPDK